jgi:Mrp family chromosome partitioning ATPase
VSTGPWIADPNVLTDQTLDELTNLRDEITRVATSSARVIRVTSGSNSRYAKSQIATQLAWLFSERKNARVLLMEADLDAPALSKVLRVNIPRGFGFSEQLERLSEGGIDESGVTLLRINANLHALVEGRTGTPALFDSPQFVATLEQQRTEHDVIVIDSPVVDTWPDSRSLESRADCVAFVVAAGTALSEAKSLSHRHFDHEHMLRILKTGDWPSH